MSQLFRNLARQAQPLTTLICVASTVIWLSILLTGGPDRPGVVERWGLLEAHQIYSGAWWPLLTTAFVHFELWHLFFNLYWVWLLGNAMERAVGSARYLAFIILADWVSSSAQFTAAWPSIGLSGIGYALVGFGWIARRHYPEFRFYLPDQTIKLFLIWLVGCWIASALHLANIGNEAHFFGLLFGVAVAAVTVRRWRPLLSGLALVLLFAASIIPLFWAPWSETWTSEQAYRAAIRKDYRAELLWLGRAQRAGADREWVLRRSLDAYRALRDTRGAQVTLDRLRKMGIDPDRGDSDAGTGG